MCVYVHSVVGAWCLVLGGWWWTVGAWWLVGCLVGWLNGWLVCCCCVVFVVSEIGPVSPKKSSPGELTPG